MSIQPDVPRLSAIFREATDRRSFLRHGSALAAALAAACRGDDQLPPRQAATDSVPAPAFNSSSMQDTALGLTHQMPAGTMRADQAAPFHVFDPVLPPLATGRTTRLSWHARELPLRIDPSTIVGAWTFEGDIPGPVVHVRVGDTVEFTLTNDGQIPHSMDFHAAQINPQTAFKSVATGESITYTFKPRYAGAFMYHCGTAPVLMHIGNGMYGAIIVSPEEPLPPAKGFVLVQSEYYVGAAVDGVLPFDFARMMVTMPDYVCFNGRPMQYMQAPIQVKLGDRVRFYVVAAGPTHDCAFHIVGEQFDRVYIGAPPRSFIEGVQTYNVPAGGGMIFDFIADVEGDFPFVNHGFGHGQKGAMGILSVRA